jgi:hypothetical protein
MRPAITLNVIGLDEAWELPSHGGQFKIDEECSCPMYLLHRYISIDNVVGQVRGGWLGHTWRYQGNGLYRL